MRCRGGASPSRRRTGVRDRLSLKWQTPKVCHCEEAKGRRGNLAVPGCIVGKLPAKSQLPSRDCHVASLLAMTRQGGYCGAPAPSSGLIPLCKALNERRYRRNRSVRFYRHLERTGSAFPRLPRRFAPRNDKSGAILILTVTCTNRQQCAGRGTPRLRDFHSIIIISRRPASAFESPCPDSSAAGSHQSACPPAPWPPRRTGSGRRGGRSRAS